jgi:hypothetical protein
LGVIAAGGSTRRRGAARPEGERCSAGIAGSASRHTGSPGAAIVRLRTAGTLRTFGTCFALAATVRTGRRRNSEMSATTTGVAAALTSVPEPQIREAASDAAADARLAMINVSTEMPLPGRWSLRPGLGTRDCTTFSLARRFAQLADPCQATLQPIAAPADLAYSAQNVPRIRPRGGHDRRCDKAAPRLSMSQKGHSGPCRSTGALSSHLRER